MLPTLAHGQNLARYAELLMIGLRVVVHTLAQASPADEEEKWHQPVQNNSLMIYSVSKILPHSHVVAICWHATGKLREVSGPLEGPAMP